MANDTVDSCGINYKKMQGKWRLIDALRGGTESMRSMRTEYLPMEEAEDQSHYANRLNRTFLFSGYTDAVDYLTARPFSRRVTYQGELPPKIGNIIENIDGNKNNLTELAKSVLTDGIDYGVTYLLVEYPSTVGLESGEQNKLEVDGVIRPFIVHVKARDVIARTKQLDDFGNSRVSSVRIKYKTIEAVGEFEEEEIEVIRVYTDSGCSEYRKGPKDKEFSYFASSEITIGKIPMVEIRFKEISDGYFEPCLYNLAETNLMHWQSSSDQRNILRYIRCGILFGSGMTAKDMENNVIGPYQVMYNKNTEARLSYVEHTGRAAEVGQNDVSMLEGRMMLQGLQPILKDSHKTATGKVIEETKSSDNLQSWLRKCESGILEAFKIAALFTKEEIADDFSINIWSDFTLSLRRSEDLNYILKMATLNLIPKKLFIEQMIKFNMLPDNIDIEKTIAESEA